jgi:Zinc finger, C2H2 type
LGQEDKLAEAEVVTIDSDEELTPSKPGPLSKKLQRKKLTTKQNVDKVISSSCLFAGIIPPTLENIFDDDDGDLDDLLASPSFRQNDNDDWETEKYESPSYLEEDFFVDSDEENSTSVTSSTSSAKKPSAKKKYQKKQDNIRKYHYSPYTISGKTKNQTRKNLEEPEGIHQCHECPAAFNKSAALKSHIGRNHNPNLKSKCPECPKLLSSRHAIKKHLLSHRPKSEWPVACPLCQQRFQAKGDLPKHFFTSIHKNDKRVPEMKSKAWFDLINTSYVNPDIIQTPKNKRRSV